MQNFRKMGALLGAGAVIISLAGCGSKASEDAGAISAGASNLASDAGAGATNAAVGAGKAVSNGAAEVGSAAANTAAGIGSAAANTAAGAANTVAGAGKSAADAVTGAGAALTLTTAVKTVLATQNTSGLKGSKIDVTTMADKKTVMLSGTVKTEQQKKLAGTLAKTKSAEFKIDNQLKVAK